MGAYHHDMVSSPLSRSQEIFLLVNSYTWTISSILGALNLSWKVTKIVLLTFFFPVVLAFGIIVLGFLAACTLYRWFLWLYRYVSPPIKWSLWHLSWPLRILWFILVGIVPSVRYMTRARLKWVLKRRSCSGSLDLEKGRHVSSPGSVLRTADTHQIWIEPHPSSSNPRLASDSPTQQPTQAGDTESSKESLSKASPRARSCEHGDDWHCWACGIQACSQCSVEVSGFPQTTQHFFCEPRCSRCYLNTMCGVLPAKKSKPCSHRQNRCKTLQKPRVCRSCSENCSDDELLRRLGEQ